MNDFVDAIKNNGKDSSGNSEDKDHDPSEERYNEVKKEEADVDQNTPAEQRYSEIKEEAKKEMIREERKDDQEEDETDEDDDEEGFITH